MNSSYSSATAKGSPLLSVSTSNSSRPSTPANADAYTFSTTLRRGEQDANPFHQVPSHPTSHHSHSHSHPHHSHAFSHNAKPATPSSRFALLTCEQTLGELNTSLEHGLQSSVVSAIRTLSGPNEFAVAPKETTLSKFLKQFYESPLNLLLFGSAGVSALVGNFDDAVSISLAITIVVTVGFVQEQRSEKSLEALNKLVPHYCHITRDGRKRTELANIVVPGDIVSFSVGDRIPADLRLLSCADLEIDESSLTGETKAVRKTHQELGHQKAESTSEKDKQAGYGNVNSTLPYNYQPAISERNNIAFMGTQVKNGRGVGVVVATGDQSEFGVIFADMQDIEDRKTPLQLSMDELAKKLSAISFAVIGVICLIGVYQKRSWLEMFTIGVSLAVAAIPEGLPIVVTVTLALGVLRMSKRKAIVKKLPSVETLGSVSVICSDKTGTLTTNEMTVARLYTVDDDLLNIENVLPQSSFSHSTAIKKLLLIGNLCNHSYVNEGKVVGQSTEVALMNVVHRLGLSDERERFSKKSEIPFNSEQKWQSVSGTHSYGNLSSSTGERDHIFMSGATETVLASCRFYLRSDGSTGALDASMSTVIMNKANEVAAALGARNVAMAYGPLDQSTSDKPDKLIFVGFQAMLDPPRQGVADAIASLNAGGVQVVMITGDSAYTARSIAQQLGIPIAGGRTSATGSFGTGVLTGKEIDALSQRQLTERIEGVSVFARTTPRHKMAIIEAYQARGKIVAMTGDGVNDAPALKLADIGISMGKGGTDVAKEAADMILVDDNFATILPAVEEGKCIFYNIQNFLCFQLSTAVAALSLVTLSTALRLPTPLNPMQILFINILMDGPPSQSLGVDPVNRDIMQRPPRPKNAPVLNQRLFLRILFSASMIVLGTLFVYAHELSDGTTTYRDQTMTFTCFVFLDLVSAIQNRGLSCGLTQNRMLVLTCSISFTVQLLLIYFPPLQAIFQTEALSFRDLTVLLILGGVSASLHEMRRRYERTLQAQLRFVEDQV